MFGQFVPPVRGELPRSDDFPVIVSSVITWFSHFSSIVIGVSLLSVSIIIYRGSVLCHQQDQIQVVEVALSRHSKVSVFV